MALNDLLTTARPVTAPEDGPGYDLLPVNKDALVDKTRALIQEAIITGRIPQGQRINETIVARQLNVSRGPIREALAGLTNQGLVKKVANRGVFVVTLTQADIEELYALRTLYEVFALHHLMTHAKPVPFAALDEIIREMGEAATRDNAESETSAVDLRFHRELVQAAGLPRLLAAWSDLMPQIQMLLYSRLLLYSRNAADADYRGVIVGAHQQIVDAIKDNDGAAAEQFLKEHIDASYRKLIENSQQNL